MTDETTYTRTITIENLERDTDGFLVPSSETEDPDGKNHLHRQLDGKWQPHD